MSKSSSTTTYDDDRLWFEKRGKSALIGITADAAEEVGSVTEIEFPETDQDFEEGDVLVTVAGSRGVVEVTAPFDCTVVEINESLDGSGGAQDHLTKDPEEGWLLKIRNQDAESDNGEESDEDGEEEDSEEDSEEE